MQILLCAATQTEIAPTIEFLNTNKFSVDVLITGVGMMAAAYSITKSVLAKRPQFILQAGIAGCLDSRLQPGEVVVVENEMIGDIGVTENGGFKSLFDLKLLEEDAYPWKNGKLLNSASLLKESGLHVVDGVTVNEITTNKDRISLYRHVLNAGVESMEGAALHYVGLMEKISFLQIRSISNFIGERDKSKWALKNAIEQLNLELQKLLSTFFV